MIAASAVFVLGFARTLSEQLRLLFPAWSALTATLLGGLSMGWFLWRRHPRLRREVVRVLAGGSDEKFRQAGSSFLRRWTLAFVGIRASSRTRSISHQ
ncbi:MAG: hypothetical protein ABJD11_06080 [Gemmatimonadota bacterium]